METVLRRKLVRNGYQISGDGKRLAFLSARAGAPQIFGANADGSEIRQVTRLAAGAQSLVGPGQTAP